MEKLVANSFGENQCAISRAQGGKPMPWTKPLRSHSDPNVTTAELSPKKTLTIAERIKPSAMNVRALQRSPKNPLANLERRQQPMQREKKPHVRLRIPRSFPISGIATLRFFRTK